jgi:putative endonuclease
MKKTSTKQWVVYMIQSTDSKLYTGITNDLERRFQQHLQKKMGASFFHFSTPEKIVYCQKHNNRSEASKRESAIKKMTRKEKLLLIEERWIKQV